MQFQQRLVGLQEHMMSFAIKLTANRDDALDLLQDTTLKVLDNQEKFVDNINFAGWVMTIMRNIFINNYHKVVRVQSIVDQNADLYNLNVPNDSISGSPDKIFQIMNKKNEKKQVETKGTKKQTQTKECKCSTSEKKSAKK